MPQTFEIRCIDDVPIVEVFGEADLSNAADLQACFSDAENSCTGPIIVSLMHAASFDSSTIHALLVFCERLKDAGRRLVLVGPSGDSGRRIVSIFGLPSRMNVVDGLPEALAAVHSLTDPQAQNPAAS